MEAVAHGAGSQGSTMLHRVIVMGVSGCGKSTVGELLGAELDAGFLDGDSLHPQANIEKMAAGRPLDDEDREPWLREVGERLGTAASGSMVIACSALKRSYRDTIRSHAPGAVFIHLHGTVELLTERMSARPGHFMPVGLLESQLDTLEPLEDDEAGVVLDIAATPARLAQEAAAWLAARA